MVKAIDIHTHPPMDPSVPRRSSPVADQMARYFRAQQPRPNDPEEMYQNYKDLDIMAVVFNADNEHATGQAYANGNDWIAQMAKQHPDYFIGFGSVDPWKGKAAIYEAERCVKELGLRGFKFHPSGQAFYPNDPQFYPLWKTIQELGMPALFHSGHAAAGSGLPGGGGFKLKYNRPIPNIDDIAADFPDMKVILAHPSWPWLSQQVSMCVHKANVFFDLSGWAPKYIPQELVREANSRIQDKALFGSDYPSLRPERWLREFADLPIKDEVRPKILLENAKKILNL